MSTIRYFLPEDGDSEDTPNVFLAPKPSRPGYPPLLGQIKSRFPLPGAYHFRFKTALVPGTDRDKNGVAVWMDCVEDSSPVPTWQGAIMAKVTRVGFDDDEYDEDFAGAGVSRTESNMSVASVQSAQPKPVAVAETASTQSVHSSDSLLGAFDDPPAPAPAAPAASVASSVHSSTENLLDVDNHPPVQAPASGGSLLDMDHHLGGAPAAGGYRGSGANTPTEHHNDLLNMSAPMPAQTHSAHSMPPAQQQRQQPMQQAPMQGQYPMQYPPQQGQYAAQQRQQMPPPQQQQQQQQRNQQNNAFDKFSGKSLDPLGNLNWNMS